MSQISKKAGFRIRIALLVLMILNFNGAIASASEKREITPETMLELTNTSRREFGAVELKFNAQLAAAAEAKASDMFSFQYFDHNSPSGATPWYWIKSSGYEYSYAGENLAIDFISAEGTHQAFMNSSSHRENILNVNYEEIGIAVKKGMFEGEETIIVVEEFGSPLSVKVPAVSVSQTEERKTPVIKNVNIASKEKKKIIQAPALNIEEEKIEIAVFENQTYIDENEKDQIDNILTDENGADFPVLKNNLFVEAIYYPNLFFKEDGMCLGVEKKEMDQEDSENATANRAETQRLLADNLLEKKYDNFVSSLDSFENKAILFLLSITMTMNLVYISSGENREDDG